MSDFDEEAERERLREQYERDRAEREATERMSELLLQGATMTSAHCSECGDPIFRYDGQEFCATCERPVDRERDAGGEESGDDGIEVTTPSDDSRVVFGGDGQDSATAESRGDEQRQEPTDESGRNPGEQRGGVGDESRRESGERRRDARRQAGDPADDDASPEQTESRSRGTEQTASGRGEKPEDRSGGGTDAARESLVRTLVAFSRRAENTDDPQRAREHLQAAREAAEALAALRR